LLDTPTLAACWVIRCTAFAKAAARVKVIVTVRSRLPIELYGPNPLADTGLYLASSLGLDDNGLRTKRHAAPLHSWPAGFLTWYHPGAHPAPLPPYIAGTETLHGCATRCVGELP